jgi:hypothetical protein
VNIGSREVEYVRRGRPTGGNEDAVRVRVAHPGEYTVNPAGDGRTVVSVVVSERAVNEGGRIRVRDI